MTEIKPARQPMSKTGALTADGHKVRATTKPGEAKKMFPGMRYYEWDDKPQVNMKGDATLSTGDRFTVCLCFEDGRLGFVTLCPVLPYGTRGRGRASREMCQGWLDAEGMGLRLEDDGAERDYPWGHMDASPTMFDSANFWGIEIDFGEDKRKIIA